LFLASLPPGFPRNPNVLLIRTHPNPFPSVANNKVPATKHPKYKTSEASKHPKPQNIRSLKMFQP
jgi:hypothetical protein